MDVLELDNIDVQPEDLLQQRQQIIEHRLPKQSQVSLYQQLEGAIENATLIQNAFEQKNMFNQDLFNKLQGFKIYQYNKIWKFDKNRLRQFSVLPLLRIIIMQEMKHLISIQFQVDIFSQKLIQMPSKIPVNEFVNSFLHATSIFEMYNHLIFGMLPVNSNPQSSMIVKLKFYLPVLKFIRKVIQVDFGYMVDLQAIRMLLLNPYEDIFLTTAQDIIEYQSQQIKLGVKGYVEQQCGQNTPQIYFEAKKTQGVLNLKYCLGSFAKKRKLIKKNKHFFSILTKEDEPKDLNSLAIRAYEQQQENLKKQQTQTMRKSINQYTTHSRLGDFAKLTSMIQ